MKENEAFRTWLFKTIDLTEERERGRETEVEIETETQTQRETHWEATLAVQGRVKHR